MNMAVMNIPVFLHNLFFLWMYAFGSLGYINWNRMDVSGLDIDLSGILQNSFPKWFLSTYFSTS
jgi:hypothetical protein